MKKLDFDQLQQLSNQLRSIFTKGNLIEAFYRSFTLDDIEQIAYAWYTKLNGAYLFRLKCNQHVAIWRLILYLLNRQQRSNGADRTEPSSAEIVEWLNATSYQDGAFLAGSNASNYAIKGLDEQWHLIGSSLALDELEEGEKAFRLSCDDLSEKVWKTLPDDVPVYALGNDDTNFSDYVTKGQVQDLALEVINDLKDEQPINQISMEDIYQLTCTILTVVTWQHLETVAIEVKQDIEDCYEYGESSPYAYLYNRAML